MNSMYTLGVLKRRIDNILFHINTNTRVLGEGKVLQDVVKSILTLISDLSLNLPYRNDLNRILIYINNNERHTSKIELLEQARSSLKTITNDLEGY